MNRHLARLWRQRCHAHISEAGIYWSYTLRSGFGLLVMLLVIGLFYWYTKHMPTTTPNGSYLLTLAAALTPLLVLSPIRTFVRDADIVFLLPYESAIRTYFVRCLLYAVVIHSLPLAALLLLALPFYSYHAASSLSGGWLVVAALLLKWSNIAGLWSQQRLRSKKHRNYFAAVRLVLTAGVLYCLLMFGVAAAATALSVSLLCCVLLLQVWPAHKVPWDLLLEKDAVQQTRLYGFFSFFTDVPALPAKVTERNYIAWLTKFIPHRPEHAYTYLLFLAFLRSEIFAMTLRLAIAACIVIILYPGLPYILWTAYGIALWLTATQLQSISALYSDSFWTAAYPVKESSLLQSGYRLQAQILAVQIVLLGIVLTVVSGLYSLVPIAASMAILWLRFKLLHRKR